MTLGSDVRSDLTLESHFSVAWRDRRMGSGLSVQSVRT